MSTKTTKAPKAGPAPKKSAPAETTITLNAKHTYLFKKLATATKTLRAFAESFVGVYFDPTDAYKKAVATMRVPKEVKDPLAAKKPGTIYERMRAQYDLFKSKTEIAPQNNIIKGTSIGVEIECFSPIPREALKQMCKEQFFKIKDGHCGEDGSVRPEYGSTGYEFRVLTNIANMDNLKKMCEFLVYIKAKVNATCGLHIHLDFRDYGEKFPEGAVDRLEAALPLLDAMVPAGRRNDQYCKTAVSRKNDGSDGGKYSKINASCFHRPEMRTIEIRLHSGTISYEKIHNWIMVLHSIARNSGPAIKGAEPGAYASALNWTPELLEYVAKRIKKFKDMPKAAVDKTYRQNARCNLGDVENFEEVA